jgi:hypothetical protein
VFVASGHPPVEVVAKIELLMGSAVTGDLTRAQISIVPERRVSSTNLPLHYSFEMVDGGRLF